MLQQLGYIKQIDGLRAIAVLMVVVFHWFPKGWVTKSGLGLIGVDMFFVISGFLITRILLVYKSNQEAGFDYHSKWHILGRFMYRRALRIFPAYFLLLFVLHQTSYYLYNTLSNDWLWYVTYLQNFLFYIRQAWPDGKLSHFWTLAVEEQFYLIWPFLMLMFPAKRILIIICIFLLIGLISFHFLPFILEKKNMVDMITPACLHAFSVGAIVAWCHISYPSWFQKILYIAFCKII
jgi:peptidoglycan/LPS O-acetylase OafA/YrhL